MLAAIDKQSYPVSLRLRNRMVNRAFVLRWKRGTEAPLDLGVEAMTEIFIDGLVSRASKWVQLDLRSASAPDATASAGIGLAEYHTNRLEAQDGHARVWAIASQVCLLAHEKIHFLAKAHRTDIRPTTAHEYSGVAGRFAYVDGSTGFNSMSCATMPSAS
jgi:hypothetical protein